jgi:two-component system chemotaxis sensor kinase CheA
MSDFAGMEDLLQDFLQEAGELLSDVDNKLVDLERSPDDRRLLNDIFRGFHTIKGGAGFLNAGELVSLCHLTESLFDKLRNAAMTLTPSLMDTIMAATQSVRNMFGEIAQGRQPASGPCRSDHQSARCMLAWHAKSGMAPAGQQLAGLSRKTPAAPAIRGAGGCRCALRMDRTGRPCTRP